MKTTEQTSQKPAEKTDSTGLSKMVYLPLLIILFAGQAYGSYLLVSQHYTSMAQFVYGSPENQKGYFELKNIVINPANSGGERYVVMSIGVEISEPSLVNELEKKGFMVKDRVIQILSSKTMEFFQSMEGKNQLKKELAIMFNDVLGRPVVRDLYFTQYVMQ
ncbi:MAG: hypothetical protein EA364_09180 [Balneolaceae bacterium]|nr:MAG: hypothetical protein EA364_09180 [Balneolaceae bacterium]